MGSRRIAILGAGISGLCTGIALKRAGIHSFTIYEKSDKLGGTWYDNSYPGACCDVPSHFYSYSFERNPRWSRAFAPQAEIQEYLEHCATKYGLRPHLRFGVEIAGARASLYKLDAEAPDGGHWPLAYMNSYGHTIAAGTNEIQRNILGERVLGLAKTK